MGLPERLNLAAQTQSPSDGLTHLPRRERSDSLRLYSSLRFWRLLVSDRPAGLDTVAMVTGPLEVVACAWVGGRLCELVCLISRSPNHQCQLRSRAQPL